MRFGQLLRAVFAAGIAAAKLNGQAKDGGETLLLAEIGERRDLHRVLEHHRHAELALQGQGPADVGCAPRRGAHRQPAGGGLRQRRAVVLVLSRPLPLKSGGGLRFAQQRAQLGEHRDTRSGRLDARGQQRVFVSRVDRRLEDARRVGAAVVEVEAQGRVLAQHALHEIAARRLDHRALAGAQALTTRREIDGSDATLECRAQWVFEVEAVDREHVGRDGILVVAFGAEIAVDRHQAGHHNPPAGVDDRQVGRCRGLDRRDLAIAHDQPRIGDRRTAIAAEQGAAAHREVTARRRRRRGILGDAGWRAECERRGEAKPRARHVHLLPEAAAPVLDVSSRYFSRWSLLRS